MDYYYYRYKLALLSNRAVKLEDLFSVYTPGGVPACGPARSTLIRSDPASRLSLETPS